MKKFIAYSIAFSFLIWFGTAFAGYELNPITGKLDKTAESTVIDFDSTDHGDTTWGAGTPFEWTFNAGAVDPIFSFNSGVLQLQDASFSILGGASQITFDGNGTFINGDTARKLIFGMTGGTYNENLRLDPDTTSNVITWDSTTGANIWDATAFTIKTAGLTSGSSLNVGAGYYSTYTPPTNGVLIQGNVGINTFNPTQKLQVVGTVLATAFVGDGSGLTGISGSGTVNSGGADYVAIYDSAGTAVSASSVISDNGTNIGISTTGPVSKLQVVGTVTATAFVGDGSGLTGISGGASGWTDGGTNVYNTTTSDTVGVGTTTPTAQFMISNVGTGATFRADDSLNDASPMIITSSGNVGIGTTVPSKVFQFGSDSTSNFITMDTINAPSMAIKAEAATSVDQLNIQANYAVANNLLDVSSSSASQTVPLVAFTQSGASSGGTLTVNQSSASSTGRAAIIVNAGTGDTLFIGDQSSDPTPFVINSNGNVGIGTTTPQAVKLQVVGTVSATAFVGDGSGLTGISGGTGGWTTDSSTKTTTTYNVGIGTINPVSTLQVVGTITATAFSSTGSTAGSLVLNEAEANGSNTFTMSAPSSMGSNRTCTVEDDSTPLDGCVTASGWVDGGASLSLATTTDSIAIGSTTPSNRLSIVGSSANNISMNVQNTDTTGLASVKVQNAEGIGFEMVSTGAGYTPASTMGVLATAGYTLSFGESDTTINMAIEGDGGVFMYNLATATNDNAVCIDATSEEIENAGNTTCVTSSARFKMDIKEADIGLAELMKLKVRQFKYRPGYDNPIRDKSGVLVGLIAEEVEQVDDRLVEYDIKGLPRSLHFESTSALAIKSIQELNTKIIVLDKRINLVVTMLLIFGFSGVLAVALFIYGRPKSDEK